MLPVSRRYYHYVRQFSDNTSNSDNFRMNPDARVVRASARVIRTTALKVPPKVPNKRKMSAGFLLAPLALGTYIT